ncbi:MAG TPA: hypothetical protein VKB41_11900 [Steroidobacteraceae bacterium]|jgi:hypothetical protein|nr:hypothetical protein [Steroidobacteraceae bacterium]
MTPEIRAFEYALGLFAVLIGLAVADIATSFHRLIRSKTPIVWDPLTLLAAVYALCIAIGMWFDIWGVRNFAETRRFFFYLTLVASLFVLFLIAAASLPDDPQEQGNLREFYAANRRYFWTLMTLFQFGYLAHGLYFVGFPLPQQYLGRILIDLAGPFAISFLLVLLKPRVVHYGGLALLFVILAYHYAPYSIN